MNKREKVLLIAFAILFGVIVGGGALTWSLKSYTALSGENAKLRKRVADMTKNIAQGAEWQGRADWAESNVPGFGSVEEARSKLLEVVQATAQKESVTITGKEFIEQAKPTMAAVASSWGQNLARSAMPPDTMAGMAAAKVSRKKNFTSA